MEQIQDYISIFTTYLLGDEAHPRAEGSGSTRETVPHGSHHDCDVETAHHGDISPGGDLKAFEGPPNSETSPPNQESQEASGKDFTSAQAAEAILRAAGLPCKDEGWEDVGQKLSEPPNFLADAPKPRSSTMGSIQQRDLGGPTVTGGLHEWEPEGSARMGFVQQEQLEEMADVKDWEPEKPLAGGQEHEELGRAGEAEGTWQKEQKETEGDEQEAPGGAESDGEEQMGLDGAAWAGGFQQQVANMVEDLRSEPDGELLGGADTEDSQQEEPDIEAGDEGVQPAVPDSAKTRGLEDKAEARSSLQWEPEETVTLELQEDDPKGVTEKGGGQQRGLEEAGMEAPQQGGPEGFVRSEGTQWRKQEENEGDEQEATGGEESVMEEQRRASTGRFQQEVAEGSEGQCLEAEGQLSGGSEAESCQQGEPHRETKDEGSQPTMLEGAETGGDQQGGPEGEAEVGRSLLWEPEKTGTLGEHLEKGNGQQQGLEGTEGGEGHQHGKAGGLARHEAAMEEEGQEEQMGEPHLERDQQTDPEASAGVSVFEAVVATAMSGEPEGQGQEPQGTEGTERSLPHEPLGDTALVDARCFTGTGAFPDEGPSLDTRAQKERVLLRRKSSIRRAPSLKRSRPPTETPPPQESGIEENSPSQPPSSGRPNLRHAGFGPMHPNMMAELQMRLRRPQ